MRLALFAVGIFALWQLSGVLLVAFSACLLAVILNAAAQGVHRLTSVPYGVALAAVVLAIILLISAGVVLLGVQVQDDFAFLLEQVPKTLNEQLERMGVDPNAIGSLDKMIGADGWFGVLGGLANYTTAAFGAATTVLLATVGGIFLAAQPELYRGILVHLFPKRMSEKVTSVLDNTGEALKHWLVGQLLLMIAIGVVTTVGLMLIGVPSALGLGVLAGLLEFIPVVGPIVAALPALMVAFSSGVDTGLWTLGLYLGVQQIESNIFVPLVQRRTVSLPPALGLMAILVFGVLLGPLGVILSAPLAVLTQVLVVQLYSRDALGWDVRIPGTHEGDS